MKKIMAILLASLMLLSSMFAYAEGSMSGEWTVAANTEITEENAALFQKALGGLTGVNYVPVSYLGSQVAAGMNHCFLCKSNIVIPDAVPTFCLVYIYEHLDGQAEITQVKGLDIAGSALAAN